MSIAFEVLVTCQQINKAHAKHGQSLFSLTKITSFQRQE